ncbi:MAG: SUMF1/EgtB/PvdO family nonheme iron enzyme [Pseudomonadota bacterium]
MRKHALVVGIDRYEDPDTTRLRYAGKDAAALAGVLREDCGFDRVELLVSGGAREPDLVALLDTVDAQGPEMAPEDLFLFYFAGHGVHMDGENYLIARNTRRRHLEFTALPLEKLKRSFGRYPAEQRVLIIDACRNDPWGGRGDADNLLSADFSRNFSAVAAASVGTVNPSTCVLFSCSEGQRAYEWRERAHGAFTYYLMEALREKAWDAQGRLQMPRVASYVEKAVARWACAAGYEQSPKSNQEGSIGEIVLAERAVPVPEQPVFSIHEQLSTLEVQSAIPGAEVVIDGGRWVINPPCEVTGIPWGEHHYRARLSGRVTTGEFVIDGYESRLELPGIEAALLYPSRTLPGMGMVWLPAGTFMMGSPETGKGRRYDEQLHQVTLTTPFLICRTPVTRAFFREVMGKDPSNFQNRSLDCPVEQVSWFDAVEFCNRLSVSDGLEPCYTGDRNAGFVWDRAARGYRLPTEAEWEYACRAGHPGPRYGALDRIAWHKGNSENKTQPVGGLEANGWGLHDMLGNVWEWCWDGAREFSHDPVVDPCGPEDVVGVDLRGGSWNNDDPDDLRVSYRYWNTRNSGHSSYGFRCVVSSQ